ncbi:MAG: helix-turn-helix domain-containing protein [Vicinamibacterales bacterium]
MQRPIEPPLTTRDVADYTGFSLEQVYGLIRDGVLEAEYAQTPGRSRGTYRIHQDALVACLQRLNWSRLPSPGPAGSDSSLD